MTPPIHGRTPYYVLYKKHKCKPGPRNFFVMFQINFYLSGRNNENKLLKITKPNVNAHIELYNIARGVELYRCDKYRQT